MAPVGIVQRGGPSNTRAFAVRLAPGSDLRKTLEDFFSQEKLSAAGVVSAVGSLSSSTIRLANAKESKTIEGPLEIVSLSGTLSTDGAHLHIAVADTVGQTTGGHLLEGCKVYTTVEVVILELTDLKFTRDQDSATGFRELVIRSK